MTVLEFMSVCCGLMSDGWHVVTNKYVLPTVQEKSRTARLCTIIL